MTQTQLRKIPFSKPDIDEATIQSVVEVLRSGWITSGPKTAGDRPKCRATAFPAAPPEFRAPGPPRPAEIPRRL